MHFALNSQMNIREGFRRFAIVFGILGLAAGLVVAAAEATSVAARFKEYSRLNTLKENFKIPSSIYRVVDAQNAGVSDDEIFKSLAAHEKWDTAAIVRAGYSKAEVLSVVEEPPRAPILNLFAVVMLPVVGFFVPWGALRSIGWMIDGFRKPDVP